MTLLFKNRKTRFQSPFIIDRGADFYDMAADIAFSKDEWRIVEFYE